MFMAFVRATFEHKSGPHMRANVAVCMQVCVCACLCVKSVANFHPEIQSHLDTSLILNHFSFHFHPDMQQKAAHTSHKQFPFYNT